jgi:hypothetical protein
VKIRNRVKITNPQRIVPGDIVAVEFMGQRVLTTKIERTIYCNEVVTFDIEEGDFEGASDGVGGVFLHIEDRDGR